MTTETVPHVGQEAPEFRLRGPGGTFHTLSEHRGHSPVVLVFYPLAFSPVCSHQLPDVQAHLAAFEEAGAIVYGISVDSHHANTAFARSLGLSFPLLSDWRREASRAYGVFLPEANTSGRATFVVGRDGRLVHVDVAEDLGPDEVPSVEQALAAVRSA